MSLSTPFIRRPIGTSLLAAGLFLAGFVAYFALPVAPLPSTDLPVIFVSTSQPGADPVTMSQTVTSTLERHLGAIAGVNEMTSTSSLGRSNIVLQFDPSRRPADAARDVQAAINAAVVDLPAGLPGPPTWRKANPNDRPVLILALTSRTMTTQSIFDVADTVLAQRLAQIPGVAQANVQGAEKSAIRVQVDVSRLAAMRLSLEDVRIAIAAANVTQATGRIEGATTAVEIDTDTRLLTAADYADLRIRTATGGTVRLGDVATVFLGVENERQAAWYGGQRAVLVQIIKQPGANVIETVDAIKAALPELSRWIPPAIDVAVINDQTGTIRASVEEVQLTLLLSIALVVMVVALFLRRLATSFAAAVTVPLSLAGTFAVMWLIGYSLDNLTLMALTIAVGFVVDDAIVMIENVVRHAEAGKPPLQAAIDGAREIGFTVLSMTLSLVAVFIPLIFSGGVQGTFLRVFAITLTVAIVVSGLVSITLTPMVCARMLRPQAPPRRIDRWLDAFGDRIAAGYLAALGWSVRHKAVMLLGLVATVGTTAWLYTKVPPGGFPTQDTGLVRGFARASTDTSFQAMAVRMQRAVEIVRNDPAVAGVGGVTGGGFFSGNTGQMYVTLKPREERGVGSEAVLNRLRPQLARIEGLQVFLFVEQDFRFGGRGGRGANQVALLSDDIDRLLQWAPDLVRAMDADPMFKDVNSDQERAGLNARVVVDRDAAARLGLQPSEINAALQNSFAQRQVSTMYRERNQYRVVLEVLPSQQRGPQDLDGVQVRGPGGVLIPLSAVARVERGVSPRSIGHDGQFAAATISYGLEEDVPAVQAIARIARLANEIGMPASIRIEAAGTGRLFRDQSSETLILFGASLLIIYIVLGVLYESLTQALTIISTLPSAGLGALLALLATGTQLSLIAVIGIILLMGIVKKNAILMVDFALVAERRDGMSPEAAILAACRARFRPIMMTTLTALFGAIPLVLAMGTGAELRRPLGIAVVGGLLVSQALTLFTTPVVYVGLRRLADRVSGPRRAAVPAPAN